MLNIQLDKPKARDMADRLRLAIGGTVMSHSDALEILSKTLGYRNWNTLSGILKRDLPVDSSSETYIADAHDAQLPNEHGEVDAQSDFKALAATYLSEPVTVYMSVYACDDFGDSPDWARVTVTVEWLATLLRLQGLAITEKVDSSSISTGPDTWSGDEDALSSYRMTAETLEVSSGHWFFRAYPKHANYAVETRMIGVEDLLSALKARGAPKVDPATVKRGEASELIWIKDVLVHDETGMLDASAFVARLVDEGVLDESHLTE